MENKMNYFDIGEDFPIVVLCDDCVEQAELDGYTLKRLGRADRIEICVHCGTKIW